MDFKQDIISKGYYPLVLCGDVYRMVSSFFLFYFGDSYNNTDTYVTFRGFG